MHALTAPESVNATPTTQNVALLGEAHSREQVSSAAPAADQQIDDDVWAPCPGQPWCGNSSLLAQALDIRSRLLKEFLWAPLTSGEAIVLSVPVHGPLSSPFGPRLHPILQRTRHHAGIDIGAPSGDTVRAAAPGTVTGAGERGGYGLLVEIDHGGGVVTRYAHLSRIEVAVGQIVPRLAVVGAVGSTGLSTGPHLHFEVRIDNIAVDPLLHMSQAQITGTEIPSPDN